ncbi:hypothetical protein DYB31_009188 [Aphanomyces astaci]|uniref:Uncharacterized protein n=1 Tax=Aphanomyces astaci TaxID=112090 RepID=A0A397EGB5_APHAT|nr:hypothetical protein DYB31_009188 [Aphanomyces astaci]
MRGAGAGRVGGEGRIVVPLQVEGSTQVTDARRHRPEKDEMLDATQERVLVLEPELGVLLASIRMKLDHICHKLKLLQQLKASRGSTNEDDDDGVTRDVTAFLTNKTVQKTANPTLELPQHTEATTRLHPLFDQDMTMESLVAVRFRVNNPVSHITLYL